ncbi:low molecular weight phosphotyrosine protein phosphatase [Spongiibacter sp. KMU-158]|uniref:protein-tyrosine-phosphatase n=1 Tax=Spongiibacter pelagi TaxID=2760804 RepID=A0A927C3S1_9GAMM|nr:low molecular weight protein-tyrosine-phosphatase [Spongiibacter pelagi]MBD2859076.1 low molecular weight phosphotyrosine protein phosphatase [Spongiibacter pelagi]
MSVSVLFVCLGNICRSPTAHGVFEQMLLEQGLAEQVEVDSAGTGDWHIGRPPDARMQAAAKQRGYDLSHLRARQVSAQDFHNFDYVLAMDKSNFSDLQAMQPHNSRGKLSLFLDFAPQQHLREVPDPYYGGEAGFYEVIDLVEAAAQGLLNDIRQTR